VNAVVLVEGVSDQIAIEASKDGWASVAHRGAQHLFVIGLRHRACVGFRGGVLFGTLGGRSAPLAPPPRYRLRARGRTGRMGRSSQRPARAAAQPSGHGRTTRVTEGHRRACRTGPLHGNQRTPGDANRLRTNVARLDGRLKPGRPLTLRSRSGRYTFNEHDRVHVGPMDLTSIAVTLGTINGAGAFRGGR
jgi:hypothetical protein